jgi:ATP-dependent helicase/DNAse subunit B
LTGSLLISGPPASGKSRTAIERYLAVPGSIFLAPSATMAEHTRHELARDGIPVRPSRITTLAQFIETRSSRPAASSALLHLLIREALEKLQVPRFQAVAEYPGFHAAIAALIEEAPRNAVPEDLAHIFGHVEAALEARGLALRATRLASAAAGSESLPPHIVFDGFFAFSPPELDLLEALSQRAALTVSLPSWSGGQASRARLLACGFQEAICPEARRRPSAEVVSAPTLDREIEEIARLILAEAAGGRPLREMGIVLRARDPYAGALETALSRFGIPARFYFADPLAAHPAVDYLSRLIEAQLAGWDHEALLSAIRMPVSGVGATSAGDGFDFKLREQLPGAGLPLRGCGDPPPQFAFLETIPWSGKCRAQEWASRLKTLRGLFRDSVPEDHLQRRDLDRLRSTAAAISAFAEVLEETAAMLADLGEMPLADFWSHARTALQLASLRIPDRRRNVVHVMDVFEARQWELPVVFVCGMMERHFPLYHREDPLLDDKARQRAGLKTSVDRQSEERFLFDVASTRATEKTIFSYARFNEKGDDSLRSTFLEGLESRSCGAKIRPRPLYPPRYPSIRPIQDDAQLAALGSMHRKLSASSIESFLQCPFLFFARKTLRLMARPAAPRDRLDLLLQGTIMHRALAEFVAMPLLGTSGFDDAFEDECRKANVPATYRTEAVRLEMLRNFQGFVEHRGLGLGWTPRPEEEFEFALNPLVEIRGRIDRMDVGPRDQVLVVDYKYSGENRIGSIVKGHEKGLLVQGGLYLAAAQRRFGLNPAGMLYCGLRKEVTWDGWHVPLPGLEEVGESRTREGLQEFIDAAVAKAGEVYESIVSGKIAPQPADTDKCDYCDFADVCRVESAARARGAGE